MLLSSSQFGDLYFVATLGGSLALPVIGRMLDRSELTRFTLFMGFCLATGCLMMSLAQSILLLGFGLLFIRCFGQGAMSVISTSTIARSFGSRRGKALSITTQGYPIGEAVLPIIISLWITEYGWRSGYIFLALSILLVFFPVVIYLLRHPSVPTKALESVELKKTKKKEKAYGFLKDFRFYLVILSGAATPLILTGLFLYQGKVAELKGWEVRTMAEAFVVFAVFRSLFALVAGSLVDAFGAKNLLGFLIVPIAAAVAVLSYGDSEINAFLFMGLCGVTLGAGGSAKAAFWAEAYGVKYIGTVRGVVALVMVFSTALAGPIFGRALDSDIQLPDILTACFALSVFCIFLGFFCSYLYSNKFKKAKY